MAIRPSARLIKKPLFDLFRLPNRCGLEIAEVGIDCSSLAGPVLIQCDRFGQRILYKEPLIVCLRRNRSISDLTPPLEGVDVNPNSELE